MEGCYSATVLLWSILKTYSPRKQSPRLSLLTHILLCAVALTALFTFDAAAKVPTIQTSPLAIVQACTGNEYATRTSDGIVCKRATDTWTNACIPATDCCTAGQLLKITPTDLSCYSLASRASTYTTPFCADCCGAGEFAVVTTLGLRCAGPGRMCTADSQCGKPTPYCDSTNKHCAQCTQDSHCKTGQTCTNNTCTCTAACPDGSTCRSGRCVIPTPPTVPLCTTDSHCTDPTPRCNTTIGRCVSCTEDSHCTGTDDYCDLQYNKCETCTWDTDYQCDSTKTKRVKHCRLADGTIKKTQQLSCNSSQICKTVGGAVQCVAPANCTASTANWTERAYACTAPLTATNHNTTQVVTDTTGTDTGTAPYQCWDGAWSKQSGGCGPSCPAGTQNWTVGSNACSATITTGIAGSTTTANDTTLNPNRGTATYLCSAGVWVEQPGSSCAPCRTCAQGCTSWAPTSSSYCAGTEFAQTRTCTNVCAAYSCDTTSTDIGTDTSSDCCDDHDDCGYSEVCFGEKCKSCTWDDSKQCGYITCTYSFVSKTSVKSCGLFSSCDLSSETCVDCGCSRGPCLKNGAPAGCWEEGFQTVVCSTSFVGCPTPGYQYTFGCTGRCD